MLGYTRGAEGDIAGARALHRRALELARRLDDPESLYSAAIPLLELPTPREQEERWQLVTEMAARSHTGVPSRQLGEWLYFAGSACLDRGGRARAEGLWEQMGQLAQRTDDAMVLVRSLFVRPRLDYLDGRLEEAISGAEHLLRRAEELGAPVRGRAFAERLSFLPLVHLGRSEEALARMREGGSDWPRRRGHAGALYSSRFCCALSSTTASRKPGNSFGVS